MLLSCFVLESAPHFTSNPTQIHMEGGCIESGLPLSDRGGRRRRKEAFLQLLLEVEAWDCLIRQLGEIDGRLRVCV